MEGGLDEELDYDFNEEFQDDEDVNTFYRDAEEEEEAKLQEVRGILAHTSGLLRRHMGRADREQERMKKEYRLANANVGDRPQIEEDMSDEEGLFGDHSLTADGKRLRRMMRKRMGSEDLFGDSDEVSGSLSSTIWAWSRHRHSASIVACQPVGTCAHGIRTRTHPRTLCAPKSRRRPKMVRPTGSAPPPVPPRDRPAHHLVVPTPPVHPRRAVVPANLLLPGRHRQRLPDRATRLLLSGRSLAARLPDVVEATRPWGGGRVRRLARVLAPQVERRVLYPVKAKARDKDKGKVGVCPRLLAVRAVLSSDEKPVRHQPLVAASLLRPARLLVLALGPSNSSGPNRPLPVQVPDQPEVHLLPSANLNLATTMPVPKTPRGRRRNHPIPRLLDQRKSLRSPA